jgi:hypothetical protein
MQISPETIEQYFQQYQWSYTRSSTNTWITGVRTSVSSFRIFIRISDHWIYFVINPFVVAPPDEEDRMRLYYHVLRLNLDMNMAKFGLDSDGDVFLAVELPTENFTYSHFSDALNGISHHAERLYSEVFNLAQNADLMRGRFDHELGMVSEEDEDYDRDDDDDADDEADLSETMKREVSRLLSLPPDDVNLPDDYDSDDDEQGPIIAGKEVRIVNDDDGSVRIEFETAHDLDDDEAENKSPDADEHDEDTSLAAPSSQVDHSAEADDAISSDDTTTASAPDNAEDDDPNDDPESDDITPQTNL